MLTISGKFILIFCSPLSSIFNHVTFDIQINNEREKKKKLLGELSCIVGKKREKSIQISGIKTVINVHCISYDIIFCCRTQNRISNFDVTDDTLRTKKKNRTNPKQEYPEHSWYYIELFFFFRLKIDSWYLEYSIHSCEGLSFTQGTFFF